MAEKQHDPTPEERDERQKIEDLTPEEALKALVETLGDRDDDSGSRGRRD